MKELLHASQSDSITLSIVVTAHSEGRLLRPTLRSISAAVERTVSEGARCELILVLDSATEDTANEARRWLTPGLIDAEVSLVESASGDASASRNLGTQSSRGRYLAFCDGDDLVSRNYFSSSLEVLAQHNGAIVHAAEIVSFGARSAVWRPLSSNEVNHEQLIRNNLWPSSSVSERATYVAHPYAVLPPASGYGPEDWFWNIETTLAGIPHLIAPGTMFFYRVRERGGVNNRHSHSILPPYDIEALAAALPGPAPSLEAGESKARRTVTAVRLSALRAMRTTLRVASRPVPANLRAKAHLRARAIYRKFVPVPVPPPHIVEALRDATEIEPAISWTANAYVALPLWNPQRDRYSFLLTSLVSQLRDSAEALVAVPWVGIGGADLVSLNYARALAADKRYAGKVTMLATYSPSKTIRSLVPENVNFVQVPEEFRELTPDQQRRLLAHVLIMIKPSIVISVNCFDITNSMQHFGRQMGSTVPIYLTLFAFDRIGAGFPVNPITDDGQRDFLDNIAGVITDNSVAAALVGEMLAIEDKMIVHYQPALESAPELRTSTHAYNDETFTEEHPLLLLWPHRLDKEKRPQSLIAIAERMREKSLPVKIHVYGQQVMSSDGPELLKSLDRVGVEYHGPYQGGLPALATDNYHALLLTSESEGLPLVLVQSLLLGLPVISTPVGGIPDLIKHNETGLLTASPDDVDGFETAIRELMDSRDLRRRLIESGHALAAKQHGIGTFTDLVHDTLG